MNIFSKKLIVSLAAVLVVFAAGCSKKPVRPTPDQTMLGQGSGAGLGSTGGDLTMGTFGDNMGNSVDGANLAPRTGDINANGEIRNVPELQSVFFDFDRSAIKDSERGKLKAVKEYLDKNPQYKLLFEGHCDWRGTAEYNLALGDRRATSAKKYALSLGVSADRIQTLSKGSLEAKENGTSEQMSQDRRVEFVVLTK